MTTVSWSSQPSMHSLLDMPTGLLLTQSLSATIHNNHSLEAEHNVFDDQFGQKLAPIAPESVSARGGVSVMGLVHTDESDIISSLPKTVEGYQPSAAPRLSPINALLNPTHETDAGMKQQTFELQSAVQNLDMQMPLSHPDLDPRFESSSVHTNIRNGVLSSVGAITHLLKTVNGPYPFKQQQNHFAPPSQASCLQLSSYPVVEQSPPQELTSSFQIIRVPGSSVRVPPGTAVEAGAAMQSADSSAPGIVDYRIQTIATQPGMLQHSATGTGQIYFPISTSLLPANPALPLQPTTDKSFSSNGVQMTLDQPVGSTSHQTSHSEHDFGQYASWISAMGPTVGIVENSHPAPVSINVESIVSAVGFDGTQALSTWGSSRVPSPYRGNIALSSSELQQAQSAPGAIDESSSDAPPPLSRDHKATTRSIGPSAASAESALSTGSSSGFSDTLTGPVRPLKPNKPNGGPASRKRVVELEDNIEQQRPTKKKSAAAALSAEEKRRIALEKNREAASKCRQKRKNRLSDMEMGLEVLSTENSTLEVQVMELEMEIRTLKGLLERSHCQ
ncbi:hypothetical protein HDU93_008810 [Gonapodya sp. JEL0774]|nr:hypothetical protein HDU93_008810 [Gonapodya sp. JEL0774]